MYDNFTERTRRVLVYAQREAKRFNHDYVGPEHILLGLVRLGEGVAADVLQSMGIDLKKIRIEVEKLGYRVIPSSANYLFVSPSDRDGKRVYEALGQRKILVRYFSDPALAHGLRISIGTREEMEKTLQALAEIG